MINVNDVDRISVLLSNIFFVGFYKGYSNRTIEERIIKSNEITSLEQGDASFLFRKTFEEIVFDLYEQEFSDIDVLATNPISLWLGDVYTRLFFKFNKSFSYIFLYLPLEEGLKLFHLYHEMDITKVYDLFCEKTSKKTILTLLLNKKRMSVNELSALTDINYNTLVSLTRSNENTYKASFNTIFKICEVLKVKPNLFAESINNFTNSEFFDFDKFNPEYRLYLAYYIASYYDSKICKTNYEHSNGALIAKDSIFIARWASKSTLNKDNTEIVASVSDTINSVIKEYHDISKLSLAIFVYDEIIEDVRLFNKYKELGFNNLILINDLHYFEISRTKITIREMTNTLYESTIALAKKKMKGDFAI